MRQKTIIILSIIIASSFIIFSFSEEKSLRFGLTAQDISTIYPWDILDLVTGSVLANIYEGLTKLSETSISIEPGLAEKWEYSDNFKTWTFYLRKNAKFHNGEPFSADSVIETFKYVKNLPVQLSKVDDYTIKMTMDEPNAALPITLAQNYYFIASKATIESYKRKDLNNAYGTGPFKLALWEKGKKIILAKNADYWGSKKAKVDSIILIPFKTNDALLKALINGDIDFTDGIVPNNIPVIRANPKLYFKAETGFNFAYLSFNNSRTPFVNKKVRKAIAYAIDKKTLINKYFYGGQAGIPAKSCIPPTMFGYYRDLPEYEYNPTLAKRLLAEAGYPDGFQTTLIPTGAVRPYMPDPIGIANEIKNQLAEINIKVTITPANSWKHSLEITTTKPDYDMALLGWIADTGDPNDLLTAILSTSSIGIHNSCLWSNKEFDNIIIQARSQPAEKRIELYKKAQLIIYEEVPLVPLFHSFQLGAWNENVKGFKLHPLGLLFLNNVYY